MVLLSDNWQSAILEALQLLAPPNGIIEVRAIGDGIGSGYYEVNRLEKVAQDIEVMDGTPNYGGIYVTLNTVNPDLLSRRSNRFLARLGKKDAATSDGDIIGRRWLPIDIDVTRPSGISSSDLEHDAAIDAAGRISRYLTEQYRFPPAIVADSGNGAHLLYRIDLPNDESSTALIRRCLEALGAMFDRPTSEGQPGYTVDQTTFNPARIWKMYGTMARKGDHTPDRPHRRSQILEMPETIEVVPLDVLQTLASQAPEEDQPKQASRRTRTGPGIDLEDWLQEHGASLPVYHAKSKSGFQTFYEFEVCPWDPSHRDRSAFMGQRSDGPLVAGCHHNGCSGRTWQDLKALVEPKRSKKCTPAKTPPPWQAKSADEEATTPFNLTDAGNSERLVRLFGDDIRHCATLKSWYVWDGRRWEIDEVHRMLDLATQTAKSVFLEAAAAPDSKEFARWALRSESLTARRAMIDGAVFMVPVRSEELDDRPELFNCENGTLNLDTGEFREHRREDLLTKISGVEYDPDATCPQWHDHLKLIFCGDGEMIRGFQEMIGYSLLQRNPENVMSILYGIGKNAKSETLRAIALIFGDYSVNIEAATLMQSRYNDGGRARPDVIRLKGARFVTCTEPEQNAQLSEGLIKTFTGCDTITARPLYAKAIEFEPGGKIFLATNYLPKIKGTDDGIWRRIWPFPFLAVVPADKRRPEYGKYLFEQEAPGIFNWLLAGLRRYQAVGRLDQPSAVQRAAQEYRIESNPIGRYLKEWYIFDPQGRIGKSEIYEGYRGWCESIGWKPISRTAFGKIMKSLFEDERDARNRYWVGIRRKTVGEIENEDLPTQRGGDATGAGDTSHDTCDELSQTFPYTPRVPKVGGDMSHVSQHDNGTLEAWFESVRLPRNFDLSEHTHHPKNSRVCSVGLCNRPATWQGEGGSWPICDHHHKLIQRRIEEVRS